LRSISHSCIKRRDFESKSSQNLVFLQFLYHIFFQIQTEIVNNEQPYEKQAHKIDLETEKEIGTEISETEFFQGLLGLREDFLTTMNLTEKNFKAKIKQGLRDNFEKIDLDENQEANEVLESIGFDCNMAERLGRVVGFEIQDPNILWQKIQSFIEVRLDALVASHPEWSKTEQTFYVFNSREKQEKQYQSILHDSQKVLNGNGDSVKTLTKSSLDQSSATETWYHATTLSEAEEIMKNGFRVKKCLPNRNFSDGDGIYFTDSIKSAKQLFQHNAFVEFVVCPDREYKKKRTATELNQPKMVVLAFTFDKEENNLLKKYEKHSIDLRNWRDPDIEERLKKIVIFFSKDPLPTCCPTIEEHGLDSDYFNNIEYIIGPQAQIISSSDEPLRNVFLNSSLTQLCIRCQGRRTYLKGDFERLIQKDVFVFDVDANTFCK
jgi:hypothetical protein